jgi:hypothetical protein
MILENLEFITVVWTEGMHLALRICQMVRVCGMFATTNISFDFIIDLAKLRKQLKVRPSFILE